MAKYSTVSTSSLELLLDTITNTFGGVLFLAMLVSLLLTQTQERVVSNERNMDPLPALSPAELVRIGTQADQIEDELADLRQVVDDLRVMQTEMTVPGAEQQMAAMNAALRDTENLSAKRVRLLQTVAEAQAAAARAARATSTVERDRTSADQAMANAILRLRKATEERERLIQSAVEITEKRVADATISTTGEAPRERETDKSEVGVMLKYGRMYMMHRISSGRRVVNTDEFIVTPGQLWNTAEPKPHAGIDLRKTDSLNARVRRYMSDYPSRSWYPCLVVHPDSFNDFLTLKECLVSMGYEYRLIPTDQGVFDQGEVNSRVQ